MVMNYLTEITMFVMRNGNDIKEQIDEKERLIK